MRSEALSRTEALYGKESLDKIKNVRVALAGLGGVGGYTLEALARTGVEHFTLIDFDTFDISNLNRQLLCLNDNIGKLKTEEAKKRLLEINPSIEVRIISEKLSSDNIESFIHGADFVIDAIDDIEAKCLLIGRCKEKNITIVSSMGAAKRIDPTKVRIGKISETFGCPLAKRIRGKLSEMNIDMDVPCVFSPEHYENASRETLGSDVTVVGTFGFILAQLVLNQIIGI